jgi:FMP27/BTLP1, N-terminal
MGLLRSAVQFGFFALLGIYIFFGFVYLFTGIRIKRVGYLSIRWIHWNSRSERLSIEIRKIGLRPQRPTVTRRTWLGIVVSDATIIVRPGHTPEWASDEEDEEMNGTPARTAEVNEVVKKVMCAMAKWLRFRVLTWVDVEFASMNLVVEGAGTFQLGSFLIGTNKTTSTCKRDRVVTPNDAQDVWSEPPKMDHQLEISIAIRDLYFSLNDKEFTEIAKTALFNVDFILCGEYGMRDIKAALRVAGLTLPYDTWVVFSGRIAEMGGKRLRTPRRPWSPERPLPNVQFLDLFEELQVLHLLASLT